MIKPSSYWAMHKTCDAYTLGRVGATLGGQDVRPPLNPAEAALVAVVRQDSEWMDERIEDRREKERARKQAYRASKMSRDVPRDTTGQCGVPRCPAPSIHPSIRPSVHPSVHPEETTNRSVSVPFTPARPRVREGGEPNGTEPNGTEPNRNGTGSGDREVLMPGGTGHAKELARKFAAAVRKDAGAFFDPEFDAVTVCAAVTGDFGSLKRWRQLVAAKGEGEVRETAFAFWREVASGEDVANRGSALNARLGALPDQAQGEHETDKTKEKTK